MPTSSPPVVWILFDEHDQEAQIAAALALRRAANDHRCAGQRRDADEYDRLADQLERVVEHVRHAYRDAHPPGETTETARPGCDGKGRAVGQDHSKRALPRNVPAPTDDHTDGRP